MPTIRSRDSATTQSDRLLETIRPTGLLPSVIAVEALLLAAAWTVLTLYGGSELANVVFGMLVALAVLFAVALVVVGGSFALSAYLRN